VKTMVRTPCKMLFSIAALTIAADFACVKQAASPGHTAKSWYIATTGRDSNPCSLSEPCATIEFASSLARPGDTVIVEPGTYGRFRTNASGTPSAYITYRSAKRWGAVVVQELHGAAWDNHGSYVVIDGFEVVGNSKAFGTTGISTDAPYTIIEHNKIHGVIPHTCNDWGGSGISLSSSHDQVIGNLVYQIGPKPCPWVHGIYFDSQFGLAAENIVFQNAGFGIHEWHQASNITVVNNTIFDNGCGGIVVGSEASSQRTPSENDHSFTANNIVYDNGPCRPVGGKKQVGYGISECCRAGETGTCNVYHNNLAYGNYSANIDVNIPPGPHNSGNIIAKPQFVNFQPDGSGDYHLLPTCPGIGKGLTRDSACGLSVNYPTFDFSGHPRPGAPGKSGFDIGAYESSH
jgi:Right handed beta helix region